MRNIFLILIILVSTSCGKKESPSSGGISGNTLLGAKKCLEEKLKWINEVPKTQDELLESLEANYSSCSTNPKDFKKYVQSVKTKHPYFLSKIFNGE